MSSTFVSLWHDRHVVLASGLCLPNNQVQGLADCPLCRPSMTFFTALRGSFTGRQSLSCDAYAVACCAVRSICLAGQWQLNPFGDCMYNMAHECC